MTFKLAKKITLGEIQGEDEWLLLELEMLLRHVFVGGGTGGGKTMLALMIMRQLINLGCGFTFVTPHPDGREKLLHWCMLNNVDPRRIVDVKPGLDCCVNVDPFAHMPKDCNRLEEETWLEAQSNRIISSLLSNVPIADQEVMNQLNAWLKNVLYCCGKRVDGDYLGLQKALMLLNVDHPEFGPAMDRLWPVMPDHIRFDYQAYRGTSNVNQRRAMVQSTVNRLRRTIFANPLVTQMFAKGAAVNDEEIITGNKIQIVSVPESDHLPREAGNVIGRMRISSMIAAAKRLSERIPEHLRPFHAIVVDESENFVSEDLRTGFQELRKFHMPIVIIVQDISCLIKGDMDLLPKVASQCGVQTTFQQQDKDSLDYLADNFSAPFLDHTPLMGLQALPVGHEIIQTQSVSFNSSRGISVGEADALTQSRSVTRQQTRSLSVQQSVSLALSSSHADGTSEGSSAGGSIGASQASNWSKGTGTSRQVTNSQSQALSQQQSQSVGQTETVNRSESNAVSQQESSNFSDTRSSQLSTSNSTGTTETESRGETDGETKSTGRSGPPLGGNQSISRNAGSSNSTSTTQATGNTSSTTTGATQGESSTVGGSVSNGTTNTVTDGVSQGASRTEGTSQGVTNTVGEAVSEGVKTQESLGGSQATSRQQNWSANQGRSSTDTNGITRTQGGSVGNTTGSSTGVSDGLSAGHTDSVSASRTEGVTIGYNQMPLAQHQIIERPTGSLVVSVADQVSRFKTCIARLPDRVMLVKVRGMNRPFLLRVHNVQDPYEQKKLFVCEEWRQFKLKQYVAKIRKAHPWYFLPTLEEEPAPAPKPKKDGKREKRKLEESPMS